MPSYDEDRDEVYDDEEEELTSEEKYPSELYDRSILNRRTL
jgi:hypothetical protein